MSTNGKPAIVFAHGLWADGSCYSKIIPALQADGHQVISAQNCLDSLEGDVAAVHRAMNRVTGPVILVGHSYAGTIITAAGEHERVVGLVYICALAPDRDETSQSQQDKFPKTPVFQHIEVADGRVWLTPEGTVDFCGDLSPSEQMLVWATQNVPTVNLFNEKAPGTAWRSKPTWYVIGRHDHTVHPDLQRAAAKRMNASVTEVDSDHVPMLSHPEVVIDVIRSAAEVAAGAAVGV